MHAPTTGCRTDAWKSYWGVNEMNLYRPTEQANRRLTRLREPAQA